MPSKPINRLPSADWRTDNLHDLWSNTEKGEFIKAEGSLHTFFQYCCLLKRVREKFENDDATIKFDSNCFFLRGGYFAFSYLNKTSSMALQGTIFGGMNHGRHPAYELPRYVAELQNKAIAKGKQVVNVLMIDEVKSGSGMGRIMKIIKDAMNKQLQNNTIFCDVNIAFYAIRPEDQNKMSEHLVNTVKKWEGTHKTLSGCLNINVTHFIGPLLGYDNDLLCGIRKTSKRGDEKEAYELVKLSDGIVTMECDSTGYPIIQAAIGQNCLVEFLSCCADEWTQKQPRALLKNLAQNINAHGCDTCRKLYKEAQGLS